MGRGSGGRSASAGGGTAAPARDRQIGGAGFGGAGANVTSPQRQTERQRQERERARNRRDAGVGSEPRGPRVSTKDINTATAAGRAEKGFRDALNSGNSSSVKSAYRKAAVANHPDKGGSEKAMKRINQMYSDWKQRRR